MKGRITESQIRQIVREEILQESGLGPERLVGKLHVNPHLYKIYQTDKWSGTYYVDVPLTIEWIGGPSEFYEGDLRTLENSSDPAKSKIFKDFESRLKHAFESINDKNFTNFNYRVFKDIYWKPSWASWAKLRDKTVKQHNSGERIIKSDDVLLHPQIKSSTARFIAHGTVDPKPGTAI